MPRIDHRIDLTFLSYETRLVLTVLYDEINALRQQAGLSVRTPLQIRQRLRDYVREHPLPEQEGGN